LSVGSASLVAISTLTSEINFYTRLIKMQDPANDRPLFQTRCIELACERCIEDGVGHECVHLLHLVPMWQSAERHRKLRVMMGDRPDLIARYRRQTTLTLSFIIQFVLAKTLCIIATVSRSHSCFDSELAGLAFDSLQQVFRKVDIKIAISITPLPFVDHQPVWLVIDPVPHSAFACPAPRPTCKPPRSLSAWCAASSRVHAGRPRR
jgi:hypothetical protein